MQWVAVVPIALPGILLGLASVPHDSCACLIVIIVSSPYRCLMYPYSTTITTIVNTQFRREYLDTLLYLGNRRSFVLTTGSGRVQDR